MSKKDTRVIYVSPQERLRGDYSEKSLGNECPALTKSCQSSVSMSDHMRKGQGGRPCGYVMTAWESKQDERELNMVADECWAAKLNMVDELEVFVWEEKVLDE